MVTGHPLFTPAVTGDRPSYDGGRVRCCCVGGDCDLGLVGRRDLGRLACRPLSSPPHTLAPRGGARPPVPPPPCCQRAARPGWGCGMTAAVAPTVVLPAGAGRDEWLAARRRGLGGSDAAAVAGLNPYAGPWSVWADKVGLNVAEVEVSEPMRWGTLLEPVIAAEAAERFGLDVRPSPGLVAHRDRQWQLATPDGLVGDDALIEVKSVGARQEDAWESGPPDMYWTQGLHYCAVTGRATVHFVALVGGQRLVHHPVVYTPADVDALVKITATPELPVETTGVVVMR